MNASDTKPPPVANLAAALDFGPGAEVAAFSLASPLVKNSKENQDNLLLIDGQGQAVFLRGQQPAQVRIDGWPAGHRRFAVLDGVGGFGQARQVAEAIVDGLLALPAQTRQESLNAVLTDLHQRLQAGYPATPHRPGATLLLLEWPAHGPALLFHVGDSRLYAVRPDGAQVLTVDHCPQTVSAIRGTHPETYWWEEVHRQNRSLISQSFVGGNDFERGAPTSPELVELTAHNLPDFLRAWSDRRPMAIESGTLYLLATDGLWSYCEPHDAVGRWPGILHAGPDLPSAVIALAKQHRQASADEPQVDNTTAIAFCLHSR